MISKKEYQNRRSHVSRQLAPDSIALVLSAHELIRNGDTHFRFRQDSYFYYLTGCNEDNAGLIITSEGQSLLFIQGADPISTQWTGPRIGQDDAKQELGMDEAYISTQWDENLYAVLANRKGIYFLFNQRKSVEHFLSKPLAMVQGKQRQGITFPDIFQDLSPILSEMRLFKSAEEINLLKKAAHISVEAHQRVMKSCRQLSYEYELEAEFLYEIKRKGCRDYAYPPIVAGGKNACILHYTNNDKALHKGDLLLLDAGGEFNGYAADITRTFPISGKFSTEQRLIYELVYEAQQAALNQIRPGYLWNDIQNTLVKVITEGLIELKLLKGSVQEHIDKKSYARYYMHNSGHWLGLDVHDCGAYKQNKEWRPLATNMVFNH